ncbi:MAG: sigma-E processing peptidase SpoIIGA [Oscillospiraceae bacterium]|jgi:stage II sporulation protein GA (sporulation sigma-E factor processing peptidase)|nr:sigma-E processing peptidase SpoIIGA [Oscillospiraceae bacterium]
MTELVYADILVAENIILTYLLLLGASAIASVRAKRWRVVLSSFAGGASSLLALLPTPPLALSLLERAGLLFLLVFAAWGWGNWKRFLRVCGAFLAVTIVFGGLMFVLEMTLKPESMFYGNGIVYFDLDMLTLILFALIGYGAARGIAALVHRRNPGAHKAQATIYIFGQSITLDAIYDSGNSLTDGFTGTPVMVVAYCAVESFLPENLRGFFQGSLSIADLPANQPWSVRLRQVPYHAVGKDGLLPAFRADKVVARMNGKDTQTLQAICAVTMDELPETYGAILQKTMVD